MNLVCKITRDNMMTWRVRCASMLLFISTVAGMAEATTYYVATTGNDTNNGAMAAPWKKLAYAISNITHGATICMAGGFYNESVVITNHNVTIQGGFNNSDPENWTWSPQSTQTIIKASTSSKPCITLAKNSSFSNTLNALTLTGGASGILIDSSTDTGYHFFSHLVISNNTKGLDVSIWRAQCGFKVSNCLIVRNSSHAFHRSTEGNSASYFFNCTIADNGGDVVRDDYYASAGITFKNCIIAANGGCVTRRGIYQGNCTKFYSTACFANQQGVGNFSGVFQLLEGNLFTNPKFVGNGDYRLRADSPCLKRGVNLATDTNLPVADDLELNARGDTYDMGCFQSAAAVVPLVLKGTVYVDAANGLDDNDGAAPASAKQTINEALRNLDENGTCYVATGAYNEAVFLTKRGTRLIGADRRTTVIQNRLPSGVGLYADDLIVSNLTVQGSYAGIERMIDSAITNTLVTDCILRNNTNGYIETIWRAAVSANPQRISHCIITSNLLYGIKFDAYRFGPGAGYTTGPRIHADNCLITGNRQHGLFADGPDIPFQLDNCTIASNTNCGLYAMTRQTPSYTMQITNCIFAGNTTGIYDNESSDSGRRIRLTRTLVANNTTNVYSKYGKGIVLGDGISTTNNVAPLFQANSYELSPNSIAVDNALDLGYMTDLLGRKRPRLGGFDIGALELQPPVGTSIKVR